MGFTLMSVLEEGGLIKFQKRYKRGGHFLIYKRGSDKRKMLQELGPE